MIDLREALQEWPYDPERMIRIVRCPDGREVLQVRTPLGLEQYELTGRPDGVRPHGAESAFDFQLNRREEAQRTGGEAQFTLTSADCAELFAEGMIYYQRYLYLFQSQQWERTVQDTTRNLRVFDFVHQHAEREEDRQYLEKWRPYLLRIRAVAAAMNVLQHGDYRESLRLLEACTAEIEALEIVDEEAFFIEKQRSLQALRQTAEHIQKNRPLSRLERLEQELEQAVAAEKYERAAALRDEIRRFRQETGPTKDESR